MLDKYLEFLEPLQKYSFLGNNGEQLAIAAIVLVMSVVFFKIIFWAVLKRLEKLSEKTETDIDDFIIALASGIKPPVYYLVALFLGTKTLTLPPTFEKVLFTIFTIVVVLQVIFIAASVVDYIIEKQVKKAGKDNGSQKTILRFLKQMLKGVIWIIGILMILGNLGINISSLVAGLGIGGLALAMASKNIIADIFSSFSILIDKPFVVGDFIGLSATDQGTVKKIGIKTTRLETKEGQELIIANKKLTDQIVQNFRTANKKKRNISFILGITYETPQKKLREIPKIIEEIVRENKEVTFKKANFDSFGDFALNFKVVIVADRIDQSKVGGVKSEINYDIVEAFNKAGIEFAYPTQTVFIKK